MTRVDFYVLPGDSRLDRYQLACRVTRKAHQAGLRVLIHTTSDEEAAHMDRLLWVFEEEGFLPHGRLGNCEHQHNPVLIGDGSTDQEEDQVLVNLGSDVPAFFSRFERLAECVDNDSRLRTASRERYKFYRDRGYPLHTHNITAGG